MLMLAVRSLLSHNVARDIERVLIRRIGLNRLLNGRHGGAGSPPHNESVGGVFIIIFEISKKTQVASDDSEDDNSEDDDCEFVEESPKKKFQNKKRKPLADLSNHNQSNVHEFSWAYVIPCL